MKTTRSGSRAREKAADTVDRVPTAVNPAAPKITMPRVAQRLNNVAKRTLDVTQSRLVLALLRSYFKSFIVGFDPKMMKVESIHRGLKLSFPDPAGFEINCATFNSLNSPFSPESLMATRFHVSDLTFTALFHTGLSGMSFTEASLHVGRMHITVVAKGEKAPRLSGGLEARLLQEWYGPGVNVNGPSSRVADGMFVRVDKLALLFPANKVVEMEGCVAISVDPLGREVGLAECWEEDAARDLKLVRKQLSCESFKVDHLVQVPLRVNELDDPTAPPRPLVRAPFVSDALVDVDAVLTKTVSTGEWKDVALALDRPLFGFLVGDLPVRISARGVPSAAPSAVGGNSGAAGSLGAESGEEVPPEKSTAAAAAAAAPKKDRKRGFFSRFFGSKRRRNAGDPEDSGKAKNASATNAAAGKNGGRSSENADSLQKQRQSSSPLEGFVCPECLAKFPNGNALVGHFEVSHAQKKAQARARNNNNGSIGSGSVGGGVGGFGDGKVSGSRLHAAVHGLASDATTGLAEAGATLGHGLVSAGRELTSGLGTAGLGAERLEALHSTLGGLEAAAAEQPMAVLAAFAEGLDVFDDALFLDEEEEEEEEEGGVNGDKEENGGGGGGGRDTSRVSQNGKGVSADGAGGGGGAGRRRKGGVPRLLAVMTDLEEATAATFERVDAVLEKQMRKVAGDGAVDTVKSATREMKSAVLDGVAKGVDGVSTGVVQGVATSVDVASTTASVTSLAAGKAAQGDLKGGVFVVGGGLAQGGAFAVTSLKGGLDQSISAGLDGLSGLGATLGGEGEGVPHQKDDFGLLPGAGVLFAGFGSVSELAAGLEASLEEGRNNTAGLAGSVGASIQEWEIGVKKKLQSPLTVDMSKPLGVPV